MIVLFRVVEETKERYVSMLCGYIRVDQGINFGINFGMSLGIKNHNNVVPIPKLITYMLVFLHVISQPITNQIGLFIYNIMIHT
jgi:hypothetical protein